MCVAHIPHRTVPTPTPPGLPPSPSSSHNSGWMTNSPVVERPFEVSLCSAAAPPRVQAKQHGGLGALSEPPAAAVSAIFRDYALFSKYNQRLLLLMKEI